MTKKRKKLRKLLAKTLAVSMIVSMLPFHSFADETADETIENITETTIENVDGSTTTNTIIVSVPETTGTGTLSDPTVTVSENTFTSTTTVTDESGAETIVDGYQVTTTTTDTTAAGTSEEGAEVTRTETSETSVTTNLNGDVTSESGGETGTITETSEKTENVASVTVDLKEGETTSATSETPDPVVTGEDPKTDENDQEYNQTVTTETAREVTATMSETSVATGTGENLDTSVEIGMEPIEQVWDESKDDVSAPKTTVTNPNGAQPAGYDYYLSGLGEDSVYDVNYTTDNTDTPTHGHPHSPTRTETAGVVQFQLTDTTATTDKNAIHTVYCVDLSTSSQDGWWYQISNLEDAGYYPNEDAENHIRAIVNHGYWGTEDGKGSLDYIKDELKAVLEADPDALGGLTADDIDKLTEGEAQTATQMAIWTYGNQIDGTLTLEAATSNAAAAERMNKIAAYWVTLTETNETTTDVITEEKFIKEMSLTVNDKVDGHENNMDENSDNDAYNVDLTFSLIVQPSERNDDLIVRVINAQGETIKIARLAGDDTSTNYGTLQPDADGNYTLTGLELAEGQDTTFNLKLEGAQYLQEGVYIYTSQVKTGQRHGDPTTSQTFVGIAEGYRSVDVSTEVTLNFNVKESTIVQETSWKSSWSRNVDPTPEDPDTPDTPDSPEAPTDPTDPTDTTDPTTPAETTPSSSRDRDDDDPSIIITVTSEPEAVVVVNTVEPAVPELISVIEDDPIPLAAAPVAAVPKTGDVSALWMLLAALSGLGLTGLTLSDKKEKK